MTVSKTYRFFGTSDTVSAEKYFKEFVSDDTKVTVVAGKSGNMVVRLDKPFDNRGMSSYTSLKGLKEMVKLFGANDVDVLDELNIKE